jgi:hypothetical protein
MKKLVLATTILLGSFATFASPIFEFNSDKIEILSQDKYKEIKLDKVPEAIKMALKKAYPEATLDKAFVDDNKEYKLEITVATQKATVYSDVEGNWITK